MYDRVEKNGVPEGSPADFSKSRARETGLKKGGSMTEEIQQSPQNQFEWERVMRAKAENMSDSKQFLLDRLYFLEKENENLKERLERYEDPDRSPPVLLEQGVAYRFTEFMRSESLRRNPADVFDSIINGIHQIFGYDRVALLIYSEERNLIEGYRAIGLPDEYIENLKISPDDTTGDRVVNYIAASFSSGEPLSVFDRSSELIYNERMSQEQKQYSTQFAVIPLHGHNKKWVISQSSG